MRPKVLWQYKHLLDKRHIMALNLHFGARFFTQFNASQIALYHFQQSKWSHRFGERGAPFLEIPEIETYCKMRWTYFPARITAQIDWPDHQYWCPRTSATLISNLIRVGVQWFPIPSLSDHSSFFFPLSLSLSLSLGERWVVLLDEFHLSLSLSVSLSLPLTHTHPHIPPHRHSVSVLEDFINKVGPVERNGHQLGAVRRQVRHSESAKADSLCQVVSEGQNLPRSARTDHCIHTHTHTQTHTHTLVWPQIICTSVYRNIPAYSEVSVPPVQYIFISKATQSRNQWQLVSMSSWKIGENESIVLTNQSVSFSKVILLIQG